MASSVIKYDGDTEWKQGETTASAPIYYRLHNGFCTITAQYSGEVTLNATALLVMTLPSEYRPTSGINFNVGNRGASLQGGYGTINPSGQLYLRSPLGDMGYFQFCVTYPVH